MNNQTTATMIVLHRPWWQRWTDTLRERWLGAAAAPEWRAFEERDYLALRDLSPSTLQDIGAPEWIGERRDAVRRIELDLMRM